MEQGSTADAEAAARQETAADAEAAAHQRRSTLLAGIAAATERLLAGIATLTDAEARGPSRLPGWSRGHVLTHLARNADGLANVLRSARTGTPIPMYASDADRDADIEAGAGRAAASLLADVRDSAAVFAREAGLMPAGAWAAAARRTPGGEQFPAAAALIRRFGEIEIHHADLGLRYRPEDWPAEFVAAYLPRVARGWAERADAPPCRLLPAGSAEFLPVGPARPGEASRPARAAGTTRPTGTAEPAGAAGAMGPTGTAGATRPAGTAGPTVTGPPAALLAWLLGRGDGAGLRVAGGGPLPVLPPWR